AARPRGRGPGLRKDRPRGGRRAGAARRRAGRARGQPLESLLPTFREPIDMNLLRPLCAALLLCASVPALAADPPATVLVVHGGAGLQREGTSQADEAALRAAITLALRRGHE